MHVLKHLRVTVAGALFGLLCAVASTFLTHRLIGLLIRPLSGLGIVTAAAAIVAIVAAYRAAVPSSKYLALST
ncbi:MAG: hypothetical protein JF612_12225, partial [Planctomycetia bacterium]|nr:hypothetical protein [Planctomycetia bacterium]